MIRKKSIYESKNWKEIAKSETNKKYHQKFKWTMEGIWPKMQTWGKDERDSFFFFQINFSYVHK